MPIKIGNTSYSDVYLGSTGIQKAYLGSTLVYNKEVTPSLPTITWTVATPQSISLEGAHTFIDNSGYMYAIMDVTCSCANGNVWRSTNWGSTWSKVISGNGDTVAGGSIGNNRFVILRCCQSVANVQKSTNGTTWTRALFASTYCYEAFNQINGYSFITAYKSRIGRTTDGANFSYSTLLTTTNHSARCSAYYNNKYYYTKNGVGTYTSSNPDASSTTAFSTVPNDSVFVAGDDKIIAFSRGSNSYKYCTGNGVTFSSTGTVPNSGAIQCIDYIDGIYWAFYNSSTAGKRVAISLDGISWTEQSVPTTFDNNIHINGNLRNSWKYNSSNGKNYIIVSNRSGKVLIGSYDA